jgi:orotate phosphoribosyltransferase
MNEQYAFECLNQVGAVIKDSHVVYTSGKHGSAYINKDALYPHTVATSELCGAIAERHRDANIDIVVAPAIGGVILSQWIADHLSNLSGHEVLSVYAEREEQSIIVAKEDTFVAVNNTSFELRAGEELVIKKPLFTIKRGYDKLVAGKRTLVAEDILNTGGSAQKTIEAARRAGGEVQYVASLCNRGGVTAQDLGVAHLDSLTSVQLDTFNEDDCPYCAQNIPINTTVGHGKQFLARQQK